MSLGRERQPQPSGEAKVVRQQIRQLDLRASFERAERLERTMEKQPLFAPQDASDPATTAHGLDPKPAKGRVLRCHGAQLHLLDGMKAAVHDGDLETDMPETASAGGGDSELHRDAVVLVQRASVTCQKVPEVRIRALDASLWGRRRPGHQGPCWPDDLKRASPDLRWAAVQGRATGFWRTMWPVAPAGNNAAPPGEVMRWQVVVAIAFWWR